MLRIINYVLMGLLLYVVFLFATFPTKLAVDTINESVPGLHVSDVSGSIWSGNAGFIKVQNFQLADVSWSFNFLSLFTGKLGVDLIIKDRDIKGQSTVAMGLGGKLVASDVNLTLPLDMVSRQLRRQVPNMRGVEISGTLKTNLEDVVFQDNRVSQLDGDINIRALHVNANVRRMMLKLDETLGNYKLTFNTTESESIGLKVKGVKDVLGLEASGELSKDKKYQLKGSISSDLPNNLIILSALPIMKPAGSGRKAFDLKGTLP